MRNKIRIIAIIIIIFLVILAGCKMEIDATLIIEDKSTEQSYSVDLYDSKKEMNSDVVFSFEENGKFGLINKETNEIIVEPTYMSIQSFSEGLALSESENEFHYLDENGNVAISIKKEYQIMYAEDFKDGIAKIGIKEILDLNQQELSQLNILNAAIDPFIGRIFGIIDKTGEFILPISCAEIGSKEWTDQDTLLVWKVTEEPKWGVINRQGEYVIEPIYDEVNMDSEDDEIFPVRIKDKWGYINKYGEIVIEPQYAFVERFEDGKAKVYDIYIDGIHVDEIAEKVDNLAYSGTALSIRVPFLIDLNDNRISNNDKYVDFSESSIGEYFSNDLASKYLDKKYYLSPPPDGVSYQTVKIFFNDVAVIERYTSWGGVEFANAEQDANGKWYLTYEYPPIEMYEVLED